MLSNINPNESTKKSVQIPKPSFKSLVYETKKSVNSYNFNVFDDHSSIDQKYEYDTFDSLTSTANPLQTSIHKDLTYIKGFSPSLRRIRTVFHSYKLLKSVTYSHFTASSLLYSISYRDSTVFMSSYYKISDTNLIFIIYKLTQYHTIDYSITLTHIFTRYLVEYNKNRFTLNNLIGLLCFCCSIFIIICYIVYFILLKKFEPKNTFSDDLSSEENSIHENDGLKSIDIDISNKDDDWI